MPVSPDCHTTRQVSLTLGRSERQSFASAEPLETDGSAAILRRMSCRSRTGIRMTLAAARSNSRRTGHTAASRKLESSALASLS